VDGQKTGIIQNTGNGSSLPNQQTSTGIYVSGDHILVKNVTVRNIYVNTSAEANSTPGQTTADVRIDNFSTNIEVCGSTLSNARTGIWNSTSAQIMTVGPSSCDGPQAANGNNIHGNLINDHCWQIAVNGSGFVNIYNNEITDYANWYYPAYPNNYHLDGIIVFSDDSTIVTPQIYSNYFHGDFAKSATGFVFCTYGVPGSGSACTIYNNLFVGEGATATGGAALYFHSSDGHPLGPHYIYSNTIIGFAYGIICDGDNTQVYSVKNNIFVSNGQYYYLGQSSPLSNLTSDHNLFYGGRNPGQAGMGAFFWGTAKYYSFAQWKSTGQDANGKEANPTLDSTYHMQSGSPGIGLGANLTSVGLAPLDVGMPSVVGPNGTSDGVQRPSAGAWDSGAFPFQAATAGPIPPTSLNAAVK